MQEQKNKEALAFLDRINLYTVIVTFITIGFLVYFNSLFSTFIWDDHSQIVNNYSIHSLSNWPNFFLGSTFAPEASQTNVDIGAGSLAGIYYKPLLTLTYSLIFSLAGLNPFPFHFVQVSLHIANAILLFVFLRRLLSEKIAFILGLIFLVHPIQVEAVSYIAALQEPLFFLFGIIALILYQKENLNIKTYILIATLLLCSLLSKETGLLFLGAVFFYFLLFKLSKTSIYSTLALIVVPFVVYSFLRFFVAKIYFQRLSDVPIMTASLTERLLTLPEVFFFYIKTFFFPHNLLIFQVWTVKELTSDFYVALLFNITFVFAILFVGSKIQSRSKKYFRVYLFFSLLFLAGLLLHLQIIPLDMTVAERWFYFPMIGLLGMIGSLFLTFTIRSAKVKSIGVYLLIIIIILLSVRTMIRNTNWFSGLALYEHDLQVRRADDRLLSLYATELISVGRYKEAQYNLEKYLTKHPGEGYHFTNLGVIYEFQGDIPRAKTTYQKALQHDATGGAYANLARIALLKDNNAKEALAITEPGLSSYPKNGKLWLLQALANYKSGNKEKALEDAKKANELTPSRLTKNTYNKILNDKPVSLIMNNQRVLIEPGQ